MKCSSRRNCSQKLALHAAARLGASMKCSSRRNCSDLRRRIDHQRPCLNEVQFPEELQQVPEDTEMIGCHASMKCSSRRNCSWC